MKVSHLIENLQTMHKPDDDIFIMQYGRDDAVEMIMNNLEEMEMPDDEIEKRLTVNVWSKVVDEMNNDDGLWNDASESFRWSVEKAWKEVRNRDEAIS